MNHTLTKPESVTTTAQGHRQTGPAADDSDDLSQKNTSNNTSPEIPAGRFGPIVFIDGENGAINQAAMAADFSDTNRYRYCTHHRKYHRHSQASGLWEERADEQAVIDIAAHIKERSDRLNLHRLVIKSTRALCKSLLQLVQGYAPLPPPSSSKLIPVANGVLDLCSGKAVLRPFREDDYFTYKLKIPYVPGAKCERFLNELIRPALGPDDENLLQRDQGRVLMRGNDAQTISIYTGPGGSGKTVLVSVLEGIITTDLSAHLRSDKLTGRFETHCYHGKSVLVGKDVSPDYLLKAGAAMIKSLTGADWFETEQKYGGKFGMRGTFYVIITANSRLLIGLNGDASAWRRRLVCYEFSRETPPKRIPNFDQVLLREEGQGILAWLVEGALAHQAELAEHGALKLTEAQQQRVDNLIMESDAERSFVEQSIVQGPGTLSVDEIWHAYVGFARERKWRIPSIQVFCTKLPHLLLELFAVSKSHDIMRDGSAVRGFRGIRFVKQEEEA